MQWLRRRCLNCGITAEVMQFATGICEGQQHCPGCGSDKGQDLPESVEHVEQYIVSEKPPPVVRLAHQARIIEWTVAECSRELEKLHGTPMRMTSKGALIKALKCAFRSLDAVVHLELSSKSKRRKKR